MRAPSLPSEPGLVKAPDIASEPKTSKKHGVKEEVVVPGYGRGRKNLCTAILERRRYGERIKMTELRGESLEIVFEEEKYANEVMSRGDLEMALGSPTLRKACLKSSNPELHLKYLNTVMRWYELTARRI